MSSAKMQLEVVTVAGKIFSGEVTHVMCVGTLGGGGIHPGHSPLLSTIKPGHLQYKVVGHEDEEVLYISGGLLEVEPHTVTVLADTIVRAEDLDEASAIEAQEQAKQLLQNKTGEVEFAKVATELAQAAAQIHAISEWRKKRKH